MRKFLLLALLSYVIGCNSPEGENTQTNTPPTGATDTSGGARMDTSGLADTLGTGNGTIRTGPDSVR